MTRRRRPTRARTADLDFAAVMALLYGRDFRTRVFGPRFGGDETAMAEAYWQHRDRLLAAMRESGRATPWAPARFDDDPDVVREIAARERAGHVERFARGDDDAGGALSAIADVLRRLDSGERGSYLDLGGQLAGQARFRRIVERLRER